MQLTDKVIVVTGGGDGIGKALCLRFAQEKPYGIVVADLNLAAATAVAEEVGGLPVECNVADESQIVRLVEASHEKYGRIDVFCSNAGIAFGGGVDATNAQWQSIWDINLMSHVYAARAVLPQMIARGSGYLLQTASAAGLLTQIGSAPYAVTKHAAVALAEWLAMTHADDGIKVSCLCPLGVRTKMLEESGEIRPLLESDALGPGEVAEAVVRGMAAEQFLILPHENVRTYLHHKTDDPDRWLRGMSRLRRTMFETAGD